MNWWIVVAIIWALVAVRIYIKTSYAIEEVKEKNPDTNPIYYDVACIVIILLWPLTIPSTIKKVIKKLKEKREGE